MRPIGPALILTDVWTDGHYAANRRFALLCERVWKCSWFHSFFVFISFGLSILFLFPAWFFIFCFCSV